MSPELVRHGAAETGCRLDRFCLPLGGFCRCSLGRRRHADPRRVCLVDFNATAPDIRFHNMQCWAKLNIPCRMPPLPAMLCIGLTHLCLVGGDCASAALSKLGPECLLRSGELLLLPYSDVQSGSSGRHSAVRFRHISYALHRNGRDAHRRGRHGELACQAFGVAPAIWIL